MLGWEKVSVLVVCNKMDLAVAGSILERGEAEEPPDWTLSAPTVVLVSTTPPKESVVIPTLTDVM